MKVLSLLFVLLFTLTGCTDVPVSPSGEEILPPVIDSGDEVLPTEPPVIAEKELFEDYYELASKELENMTLEEKIGQLFLVQYPGKSTTEKEISKYCPGGYILFAKDVKNESKESLTNLISEFQDEAKHNMFFAVDEEGGPVVRVSAYSQYRNKPYEAVRKIYDKGGMDAVIEDSHDKNEFLKSFGFNMNLTPVVDIPTNSKSYMYSRAISIDEEIVSEFASKVIAKMNEDNVVASMKHFPGYGDNVDTHTGIAVDERTLEDFNNKDLKPFIAGIENDVPTIMVNHNIIKEVDDQKPASISKPVHDILRNDLGFSGLIVTDSLSMDAIKQYVENGEAAAEAIIAGNDLIISATLETHVNEILKAMEEGRITEDQINTACKRVLACKMAYGIIEK